MTDSIDLADKAEEDAAAMSLRSAQDKGELVSVWAAYCDHFEGAARERLQEEYAIRLRQFVPLERAG